jgi:hypothetical protein
MKKLGAEVRTQLGGGDVKFGLPGSCPIILVTHVVGVAEFASHGFARPKQHWIVYGPVSVPGVVKVIELLSAEL